MKLDGKVAVITGGASGMGAATARLFVEEGARVVIGDIQDEKGEAVAAELGASGAYTHADVSAGEDLQSLMRSAIDRFGGLDVLFNNAGVALAEGEIIDCTEELFDRILATNLKSVWLGMKYALPAMVEAGGGSIVSTASIAGLRALRHEAAYGASKAGIIQLTRVCAIDYAERGIRANCICPGGILTPLIYDNPGRGGRRDPEELATQLADLQPIPRAGQPTDIAQAALWLASDDSSFVTGQAIVVDGGWTASARTPSRRRR